MGLALVAAVWMGGCTTTAPDPPAAQAQLTQAELVALRLVGFDGVRRVQGGFRFMFDGNRPARLAAPTGFGGDGLSFELRLGDAVTTLSYHRGPQLLVELPPDQAGEGALLANLRGREVARWPIELRGQPSVTKASIEVARAHWAAGRPKAAVDAWVAVAEAAVQQGVVSEATRALRAAAHLASTSGALGRARSLLARAEGLGEGVPDPLGRAKTTYTRGVLSQRLGAYARAREALGGAIVSFEALGELALAAGAVEALALLLVEIGDHAGARRALARAEPWLLDAEPSVRARFRLNQGWALLRAGQAQAALKPLREALEQSRIEGNSDREANALGNLGEAFLALDRLDAAERALVSAGVLSPSDGVDAQHRALQLATIYLRRAHWEVAQDAFEGVLRTAKRTGAADLQWRAVFGLGQIAAARGLNSAAITRYEEALSVAQRLASRVSLRQGRGAFYADRRGLNEALVDALLKAGQPAHAFAVADSARAQVLRGFQSAARLATLTPDQRADWARLVGRVHRTAREAAASARREPLVPLADRSVWRQADEALHLERQRAVDAAFETLDQWAPIARRVDASQVSGALAADEAVLLLTRAGVGWRGFWVDSSGVVSVSLSDDLLAVFSRRRRAVGHLYLVPGGHPQAVELAKAQLNLGSVSVLPFAGLLLDQPVSSSGAGGLPLVIGDPRGDLPWAAREAREVATRLKGRLLLRAAATRAAVVDGITSAPLVHFAGHGVLVPEAPWDAHLLLAGTERLSLLDTLSLSLSARLVTLSGCNTGDDRVLVDEATIGLPEALLAAGAGSVVAIDRAIDDGIARRFMGLFYGAGGARQPAEALRKAALVLREERVEAWDAFRLIGRR